jgi:hypothetical protein
MHDFPKFNPLHSKMDCIAYNDRIQLAIADLESQERLNYADTAKKKGMSIDPRCRGAIET